MANDTVPGMSRRKPSRRPVGHRRPKSGAELSQSSSWLVPGRLALPAICLVLWALHSWLFLSWLPTENGTVGHDYAYFFPALVNGYFWHMQNGWFSVPWFTPALCGGVPLYPNPESMFYSLPQLLTVWSDPLTAVRATFVIFSGIGLSGTVLLLRRVFGLGAAASVFGAGVILFNGYFAHRMLIGHLGFHSVMLVPFIAYFMLRSFPDDSSARRRQWLLDSVLAGLAVTYMIQSGNHDLMPTALAVAGVGLLHVMRGGPWRAFVIRGLAGGAFALCLSASKLMAGFRFLESFPRSGYPVPGSETLFGAVRVALQSLFGAPAHDLANALFVNTPFALERQEFEYGLTVVPALVLLAAGLRWMWAARQAGQRPSLPRGAHAVAAGAFAALLIVPVIMNYHSPFWIDVVKRIPVLKNSSSFVRWIGIYIPIVGVGAALALASFRDRRLRWSVSLLGLTGIVAINAGTDRAYYADQPYEPAQVVQAMTRARAAGQPIPITNLSGVNALNRNDGMVAGQSPIACYEAIFGYRLEWFPPNRLQPGPALEAVGDRLNLLDPACFAFPNANDCAPGKRFDAADAERARRFTRYYPIPFEKPLVQRAADVVNLAGLGTLAIVLVTGRARGKRSRKRK